MTAVYSIKTLAERWSCDHKTIRRMIERGDLPTFRTGAKLLRIRGEDVERWENSGGSTKSANTGSDTSRGKRSQSGGTRTATTAEDWATRLPK